jgi:hypothetical protein
MTATTILKNAAYVSAILLVYGIHAVLGVPKPLVGFVILCVLVVSVPSIDTLALWCIYSVVYWACDLPPEDNFVLLAATTLFFAGVDLAEEWLPISLLNKHRDTLLLTVKLVSVLPIACNSLLFHPVGGCVRALFYWAVLYLKQRESASILFSKSESFVVLLIWHFIVILAAARLRQPEGVLPVATTPGVTVQPPKRG